MAALPPHATDFSAEEIPMSPLRLFDQNLKDNTRQLDDHLKRFFNCMMSDAQKQAVTSALRDTAGDSMPSCDPWFFSRLYDRVHNVFPSVRESYISGGPDVLQVDGTPILAYSVYEAVLHCGGLERVREYNLYGMVGVRLGLPSFDGLNCSVSFTGPLKAFCESVLERLHAMYTRILDTHYKIHLWRSVLGSGPTGPFDVRRPPASRSSAVGTTGFLALTVLLPLLRLIVQGRRYVGFSDRHLNILQQDFASLTEEKQAHLLAYFHEEQHNWL